MPSSDPCASVFIRVSFFRAGCYRVSSGGGSAGDVKSISIFFSFLTWSRSAAAFSNSNSFAAAFISDSRRRISVSSSSGEEYRTASSATAGNS